MFRSLYPEWVRGTHEFCCLVTMDTKSDLTGCGVPFWFESGLTNEPKFVLFGLHVVGDRLSLVPKTLPTPAAPAQQVTRGVLAVKPFRKLWNSMLFSSLGDWLGLLATTAMAQQLSGGDYAKANFAIAGVFIARLLPAVFLGPIAYTLSLHDALPI